MTYAERNILLRKHFAASLSASELWQYGDPDGPGLVFQNEREER
jgi:hypothetical protein